MSSTMQPAADLRLVSVEQLKKIHRDLDACQKVIWLAGVRPRGYGFDPAYCTDAQARLKEIETLIADAPQPAVQQNGWAKKKPTVPGAYWIRGFRLFAANPGLPALVDVRLEGADLISNMHMHNSDDCLRQWELVSDISGEFEWLGPLALLGGR